MREKLLFTHLQPSINFGNECVFETWNKWLSFRKTDTVEEKKGLKPLCQKSTCNPIQT